MIRSNTKEIWLIRHGETSWSQSGKHTGRTDVPLTEAGRSSAVELRKSLGRKPFDLVLTSPFLRARETCELAGLGEHAQITTDLAEWDYGIFEGLTTKEIQVDRPGWSIWNTEVPKGETDRGTVHGRVDECRCASPHARDPEVHFWSRSRKALWKKGETPWQHARARRAAHRSRCRHVARAGAPGRPGLPHRRAQLFLSLIWTK